MRHLLRVLFISAFCIILLSGCGDYRAMKDTEIVAGYAVDKNEEGEYEFTIEIIDIASDKKGAKSTVITATGATLHEASRNCKEKISNWIYYGSVRTIIIGQDLARDEGISYIIDTVLREVQLRDDICVVISQEDSAKSLLMAKGMETDNTSYEMADIISGDYRSNSTSVYVKVFEVYDEIHTKGKELVLPAFHIVKNGDVELAELNGIAIFQYDKLVGYMSPEYTKYCTMLTKSDTTGGVLSFIDPETENTVFLDIEKCTNKSDVQYFDGKVSIDATVTVQCTIDEYPSGELTADSTITRLEKEIESFLANRITEVFQKIQKDPGVDIYGYGNKVYKDQYEVWLTISDQWNELFQNAEFNIQVNATILNNSVIS